MKKLFKILIFASWVTSSISSCAMLPLTSEVAFTKNGHKLRIIPAQKPEDRALTVNLIASCSDVYSAICAYFITPRGERILGGAATFIAPSSARSYLHLANIVVKPEFQNEGVGSALLTYLLEKVQCPVTLYSLDTKTTGFYQKFGFYSYDTTIPEEMQRDYLPPCLLNHHDLKNNA
jgi:N-acetylglutamate synthase-like GNAT family acetyltransferase